MEHFIGPERRIIDELGSGTDGWVFSLEPHSVVKVHEHKRRFFMELRAYERLKRHRVTSIAGCNVPVLRGHDPDALILEMSFVSPPYVIDFGKSRLDTPADFNDDAWRYWERKIEYMYGEDTGWALRVHRHLIEKYGIYHDDVKPDNINLGDTPEVSPDEDFDL